MKKSLSILLTLAILVTFAGNAFAYNGDNSNLSSESPTITVSDAARAVELLEEHVVRLGDGTFKIDTPEYFEEIISDEILIQIMNGMNVVNALISKGVLFSTKNLEVYNVGLISYDAQSIFTRGGVNKIVWRWYGWDLYLSHSICHFIVHGGAGASGLAAIIAAVIPAAAPVAGVIAGVLVISTAIISYNDKGNGVVMKMLPLGHIFWISGQ